MRHRRRPAAAKRRRRPDLLATLGILLLAVGLGFGSAIAWSVFGTDVTANQATERDVAEFRALAPDVVVRPASLHTDFSTFPPPSADSGPTTWGLLHVPSWTGKTGVYGEAINDAIPIKEGTTAAVLDTGAAGHEIGTAGPGQLGNFTLAAHRRSHGSNFTHLPDLRPEDYLIVETPAAWYVYEVTGAEVVLPEQNDVIAPVPGRPGANPTERLITLYTCHSVTLGAWGNDHRWVVHGKLVGWLEHDAGVPSQLLAPTR